MIKDDHKIFHYQTKLYWYEDERKRLEKNVEEARENEKRTKAYLERKQVSSFQLRKLHRRIKIF